MGRERFEATQILFNSPKDKGLCEAINDSISKCDLEHRRMLFENIILCGGTSLLPGIDTAISHRLKKLVLPNFVENVDVIRPVHR